MEDGRPAGRRARPAAPQMKTGQIGGEVLFSSGAKKELHGRWAPALPNRRARRLPALPPDIRRTPDVDGWAGTAAAAPCCRPRRPDG